jgi:acetyltransferase-like isoleucine patch superfamily enzyme
MLRIGHRLRSIAWFHRLARWTLMAYRRRRFGLRHVHSTFYMARGCSIASDLHAREYSFMNIGCVLDSRVELGRYAMLAPYVSIVGRDHIFSIPGSPIIFSGRPEGVPTTIIEDDVWVGFRATILAGVRIGRGAIVGAGSVVTKDIPPYEIHAGIPAHKIGERFVVGADRLRHDAMLDGPVVDARFCPPAA